MDERAEQALRDALAFAESIIDTVRDPLLVLDGGLRVVTASREFYRAFGVAPGETEGRLVYELGNRQWDIPRLRTLLEEILPRSTTFRDFEVEHAFEHIGRKVMLLNARRLRRGPGEREMILLAIEDATARRDAEEARREAETRFTDMVRNVRDHSIFLTDPDGVITSWNVAAERVIGYAESEAVGKHFSLIFTPDDVRAGLPAWELRTAREAGRAEDERWHVKKGGSRFWALGIVTPLHDAAGRLTGFSKILRDMTDRKRAEEAVRLSEEQFRQLADAMPQVAWRTDAAGRVQYVNRCWTDYTGLTLEESQADGRLRDVVHPDDFDGMMRRWRESLATGREYESLLRFRRAADGAYRWFLSRGVAATDAQGRVRHWFGTATDVEDQKRAEQSLREARDELERRVAERTAELVRSQERALQAGRLAAIGQTVTALAHEGRNALQRAHANLSRLGWKLDGRPEELDLLGRARQALDDLQRLFDDIRNYAAPIHPDFQACDLGQVWRDAWAQVVAGRAGRDARLEEETGGLSLACEADPFRLGQVFTNLLANALEACPDPVRVVVSCRDARLGGRPAVTVCVRDNGPGFSDEQRRRAFEPFQTTKPTGTGLGMAIAKRVVEAHGGCIALAETTGRGAEVVITLPRQKP